jgi:hypothetical protein
MSQHDKPFYGEEIIRDAQADYINTLLKPFKNRPADEALKKEIWDLLQAEKHAGRVTIPFKVALEKDPNNRFPPTIKIILDSKV